jgi:mRNA-degrading endonuclease RelE of RelBE toxin-antitoxin system
MTYIQVFTKPFLKDVKGIKKDKKLLERLNNKIDEILKNPRHYPQKKYNLKGKQGAHVGSYVIVFETKGREVIFHQFKHHDFAYV